MATGKEGFDCPGVHFGRGSVMVGFGRKSDGEGYGKKGLWDCGKGERKRGKGKGVCNGAVIAQEGKVKRTLSSNVCIVIKPSD